MASTLAESGNDCLDHAREVVAGMLLSESFFHLNGHVIPPQVQDALLALKKGPQNFQWLVARGQHVVGISRLHIEPLHNGECHSVRRWTVAEQEVSEEDLS